MVSVKNGTIQISLPSQPLAALHTAAILMDNDRLWASSTLVLVETGRGLASGT